MLKPLAAALSASLMLLASGTFAEEPINYDWSGAYVGLTVGSMALTGETASEFGEVPAVTPELDDRMQPQLGISAGYNVMVNDFLMLGIEGDVSAPVPALPAN